MIYEAVAHGISVLNDNQYSPKGIFLKQAALLFEATLILRAHQGLSNQHCLQMQNNIDRVND